MAELSVDVTESGRPCAGEVRASLTQLLEASRCCTLATVDASGAPYVNSSFFAWTSDLTLVVMSDPGSQHSQNLLRDPRVAVAIRPEEPVPGGGRLLGAHLRGVMRPAERLAAVSAIAAVGRRFGSMAVPGRRGPTGSLHKLRPYVINLLEIKLVDSALTPSSRTLTVGAPGAVEAVAATGS